MNYRREDVPKVDDSKAKTFFETTAEILQCLITTFEHYGQRAEEAWK